MSQKNNDEKVEDGKEKIKRLEHMLGFHFKDLSSFERFVRLMYSPTDPASLGVTRLLFGLLMLLDISEERGGADIDLRWGEPRDCHFPLIPFITPMSLPYMGLTYGLMWLGALGIMLGIAFRKSATIFILTYWYIFLIDKSFWNNHSYLFGLVALLLVGTSSNHYCSIDGIFDKKKRNADVPLWNYFILKFQFFLLYFLAGLKKSDTEWLEGYAMTNLSRHWVFDPFKLFLTIDQIDFLVVHWFGFVFDLTVGFWMLIDITRPYAMIFCATFHFMNSRLFSIGMFPYVCLATMPLFCYADWPKQLMHNIKKHIFKLKTSTISKSTKSRACIYSNAKGTFKSERQILNSKVSWKHKLVVGLLLSHCGVQMFLPYSHFITQGYNNWTNGLYGYSWDMMVHAWDTILVVVKIVDNNNGQEHFLDPAAWVLNDRWNKHGDMMHQYARCLERNLVNELRKNHIKLEKTEATPETLTSENISIYIDVWCSLNGRFQQRMFNPSFDLLKVDWSPFHPVPWLMPLLIEFSDWRTKLTEIQRHVYSWSNYTDVIFVADFPGLYLENYISPDLTNTTLTILEGQVFYIQEDKITAQDFGQKLTRGMSLRIPSGIFHKILTISATPACYMYTYENRTKQILESQEKTIISNLDSQTFLMKSPFPLLEDLHTRLENMQQMFKIVTNSIVNLLYDIPMLRRVKIYN